MADSYLVINQGATDVIRIPEVRDSAGALITNWSGYSVRAQVRSRAESPTVLHEWTTGAGNASFEDSDIVLTVPAAISAAWDWVTGRYDVELVDPTSQVARVAEGHIIVSREVTR